MTTDKRRKRQLQEGTTQWQELAGLKAKYRYTALLHQRSGELEIDLLRLLRTHQAALNKTISEHTHPDFAVARHKEWALTDTLISLLEKANKRH